MTGIRKAKIAADTVIRVCSGGMAWLLYRERPEWSWLPGIFLGMLLCMAAAAADLILQCLKREELSAPSQKTIGINRLILLDEQDKPVRHWEMAGKTCAVIGRRENGQEEEVDIDLGDCEYGTFIDPCHAVLNFCLDSWYIEDLGSQNGVKVRKVEDGICYKVLNRPCKISAGDILYIANTRLLLT